MHHIRAVLKFVLPSAAAFAVAGLLVVGSSSPGLASTSTATVSMGEASVLSTTDSGNGNHLLAQQAALPQDGTLQELSFYVANAAGKLRLAVYDSSGPGGAPGTLEAQTPEITPVVGWNTVAVTSPTVLQAGYYWLAYLASDNGLAFKVAQTGIYKQYALPYGALPTTFNNAAATSGPAHWSFYGTLQTTGSSAAAATTTGSPTTRAAWFYSRPTDGTTPLTIAQRSQTMILSGSDYEVGFLGQVRSAGWTKPILEYVDEAFAMGPSSAMTGTCASGYTGYTTTWTSGLNDFCNKVSPNESWFLHNGAGQRIYRDAGGGSYFYLMNPAAPGWRSFVQAKTASLPASYHMDGVFLDDVWATANRPRSRETNSDGTCRECGTDAQWLQAQVGMVQAIKGGAGAQPVWINSDSTSDLVAPVDGFMIENMGASWGTSFMSQAEVEQRLRDVDTNVAAGKDALLVGQGNQSDVERMRFSHAIYLLVAGPQSRTGSRTQAITAPFGITRSTDSTSAIRAVHAIRWAVRFGGATSAQEPPSSTSRTPRRRPSTWAPRTHFPAVDSDECHACARPRDGAQPGRLDAACCGAGVGAECAGFCRDGVERDGRVGCGVRDRWWVSVVAWRQS